LHVGCSIYHGDPGVLQAVEQIRELAGEFNVRAVVFDPWRFGQAAQELEQAGLTVIQFAQNDTRMVPASLRLWSAVTEQRLVLPDHPELAAHAAAAIAKQSRRGWRLDKPSPRAQIDAMIALCMAVDAAEARNAPIELLGFL
jgi:phage terminase large subunit-like protein